MLVFFDGNICAIKTVAYVRRLPPFSSSEMKLFMFQSKAPVNVGFNHTEDIKFSEFKTTMYYIVL